MDLFDGSAAFEVSGYQPVVGLIRWNCLLRFGLFIVSLCQSICPFFISGRKGGLPKSYRAVACKAGPLPFAGKWMA